MSLPLLLLCFVSVAGDVQCTDTMVVDTVLEWTTPGSPDLLGEHVAPGTLTVGYHEADCTFRRVHTLTYAGRSFDGMHTVYVVADDDVIHRDGGEQPVVRSSHICAAQAMHGGEP